MCRMVIGQRAPRLCSPQRDRSLTPRGTPRGSRPEVSLASRSPRAISPRGVAQTDVDLNRRCRDLSPGAGAIGWRIPAASASLWPTPWSGSTAWVPPPLPPVSTDLTSRILALEEQQASPAPISPPPDQDLERRIEQLSAELRVAEAAAERSSTLEEQLALGAAEWRAHALELEKRMEEGEEQAARRAAEEARRGELSASEARERLHEARYAEQRQAIEGQHRELQDRHAAASSEQEDLQRRLAALSTDNERLRADTERLREAHAAEQQARREAHERSSLVTSELERLRTSAEEGLAKRRALEAQLEQLQGSVNSEALSRQHREAEAELRAELEQLRLARDAQAAGRTDAEQGRDLEVVSRQEAERARDAAHAENQRLEAFVAQSRADLHESGARFSATEERLQASERRAQELTGEIARLVAVSEDSKSRLQSVDSERTEMERTRETLIIRETEIRTLKAQVVDMEGLRAQLAQLQGERDTLASDTHHLKEMNKKREHEIDRLRHSVTSEKETTNRVRKSLETLEKKESIRRTSHDESRPSSMTKTRSHAISVDLLNEPERRERRTSTTHSVVVDLGAEAGLEGSRASLGSGAKRGSAASAKLPAGQRQPTVLTTPRGSRVSRSSADATSAAAMVVDLGAS